MLESLRKFVNKKFDQSISSFGFVAPIIYRFTGIRQIGSFALMTLTQTALEGARMAYLLALIQQLIHSDKSQAVGNLSLFGFGFTLPLLQFGASDGAQLLMTTLLVWVCHTTVGIYSQLWATRMEVGLVARIRNRVTEQVFSMNLDELVQYQEGRFHGLWQHSRHVGTALGVFYRVLLSFMTLACMLFLIIKVYPMGFLVIGGIWLVLFPSQRYFSNRVRANSAIANAINNQALAHLEQFLYGMRLIKLAKLESRERDRQDLLHDNYNQRHLTSKVLQQVSTGVAEIIAFASVVAVVSLGISYQLNTEKIVAFSLLLVRIAPVLVTLGTMRMQWAEMHGPIEDLRSFLSGRDLNTAETLLEVESSAPTERLPCPNMIQVQNVSYAYLKRNPVLHSVSATFRKGQITAVMGVTGSGKSTLMDILAGFRRPTAGQMQLVSESLESEQPDEYYGRRVGYASQEPIIFNNTLRENLKFFVENAGERELMEAVKLACAEELVRDLPRGLDEKLGQRGSLISGGQRQRVALARVLLQNKDILLLDEATSAIDLLTESRILKSLELMKRDRIVVLATHRLSSAHLFDHIILMHGGKILEEGSHKDLMAKAGVYRELYFLQESNPGSDMDKLSAMLRM